MNGMSALQTENLLHPHFSVECLDLVAAIVLGFIKGHVRIAVQFLGGLGVVHHAKTERDRDTAAIEAVIVVFQRGFLDDEADAIRYARGDFLICVSENNGESSPPVRATNTSSPSELFITFATTLNTRSPTW